MFWLIPLETTSTPALLIKKIAAYAGQVAEILFKDLNPDMLVFQKNMSSIVTKFGPET